MEGAITLHAAKESASRLGDCLFSLILKYYKRN